MTRETMTLEVIGQRAELQAFFLLCGAIQYLGHVGSSRTITVAVDGDGSGCLRFKLGGQDIPNNTNLQHDIGE